MRRHESPAVQHTLTLILSCIIPSCFDALDGALTGVISERDYITKIALLGRTSKATKVKEIATQSAKVITVTVKEPVESCMQKMLSSDIRHVSVLVSMCASSCSCGVPAVL